MVLPDMNPLLKQANGRLGLITGIKLVLEKSLLWVCEPQCVG